jgi:mannosyltransferase OCH1-like enzyme
MPTTLFQYWDSPRPPADVAAAMASVRERNPEFLVQVHDRASAAAFITARFGARHAAAFAACAVPAMQADYFRYCAVLAEGGAYLDADSLCVGTLSPLLARGERGLVFRRGHDTIVNACFSFHAPGAPLLAVALEVATRGIERRLFRSVWVATGPGIFTYLYLLHRMTPEERSALDYDHIDPEATTSIRLCDEVARAHDGDVHALFDGLEVLPYGRLQAICPELEAEYKSGATHWPAWPGDIHS